MPPKTRRTKHRRTPRISIENATDPRDFARAVSPLPPTQREALRLRYLQRLPVEEIAHRLQKSIPATDALIRQALRSLRAAAPQLRDSNLDFDDESQYHPPVSARQASQNLGPQTFSPLEQLRLPRVPRRSDRIGAFLDQVDLKLAPSREALASYLQESLRALGTVEPKTLEQGQAIARRANQLVRTYGLRFRFPGTGSPGSLTFVQLKPKAPGIFRITAEVDGVNRTASIHRDFGNLEVFAPRPGPLRTSSS